MSDLFTALYSFDKLVSASYPECTDLKVLLEKQCTEEILLAHATAALVKVHSMLNPPAAWYIDSGLAQAYIHSLSQLDAYYTNDEIILRDGLMMLQKIGISMTVQEAHFTLLSLGLADWLWEEIASEDVLYGLYQLTFLSFCCFEDLSTFSILLHRYIINNYCLEEVQESLALSGESGLFSFCLSYLNHLISACPEKGAEIGDDLGHVLALIAEVLSPFGGSLYSIPMYRKNQDILSTLNFFQDICGVLDDDSASELWNLVFRLLKYPDTNDHIKNTIIRFIKDFGAVYDVPNKDKLLDLIAVHLSKILPHSTLDQLDQVVSMLYSYIQTYHQLRANHPRYKLSRDGRSMIEHFLLFYDYEKDLFTFSEPLENCIACLRKIEDEQRRTSRRFLGLFHLGGERELRI